MKRPTRTRRNPKPKANASVWLGMNPPQERPARQFRQFSGCEAAITPREPRKPDPR